MDLVGEISIMEVFYLQISKTLKSFRIVLDIYLSVEYSLRHKLTLFRIL